MNGAVVAAVVFAVALTIGVVAVAVRIVRHRNSSVEYRGRRALMDLGIDRGRRQVWGAASVGIIAAGSEFGGGGGCVGGGGGGCGGGGCGGGCGG